MNLTEYRRIFPQEDVWRAMDSPHAIEGMLLFDETASNWAGPFDGGFAYFRLTDTTGDVDEPWTEASFREYKRFAHWYLPQRVRSMFNQPAQNEEQLQKRLALLTPKELKTWETTLAAIPIDVPTVEKPIKLFLAGNDDSSYTKFFATMAEAQAELQMLESDQPLNFALHIKENGFVFTN